MRDEGMEVVYLEKVGGECISEREVGEKLIKDILRECKKRILGDESEIKELF
ncbi:hypothetical protein [Staphylococcus epidermidis]|uniref:hypothetical protein n=1 Tax=Staphylococcus epidermidis TaxID=1282 RepID=UPI0016427B14|nr:hypothetical protein [Staphylococcus epidermidis]